MSAFVDTPRREAIFESESPDCTVTDDGFVGSCDATFVRTEFTEGMRDDLSGRRSCGWEKLAEE
jgi:hypothetical protein